jgi:hypothetical protein
MCTKILKFAQPCVARFTWRIDYEFSISDKFGNGIASQERNALYYITWSESVHYDRSARSRSGRCIAISNSQVFDFEQGAALGMLYL